MAGGLFVVGFSGSRWQRAPRVPARPTVCAETFDESRDYDGGTRRALKVDLQPKLDVTWDRLHIKIPEARVVVVAQHVKLVTCQSPDIEAVRRLGRKALRQRDRKEVVGQRSLAVPRTRHQALDPDQLRGSRRCA